MENADIEVPDFEKQQEDDWLEFELQKGFDDLEAGRVRSFDSLDALRDAVIEKVRASNG